MTTRLYATFAVADMMFGVEAVDVQEILRHQPLTPVPLAPAEVSGLMNLRGEIVLALDMRERLGLGARPQDQTPVDIVLRTNDGPVALIADDVGDVCQAADDALLPRPAAIAGPARDLIRAVHQLDDGVLLIIDVHKAAQATTT